MSDPNPFPGICYCGNYGGGRHTKSARCPDPTRVDEPPQFIIEWVDGKRKAVMAARPEYPNGIDINFALPDLKGCKVPLPYPAQRCGFYSVECTQCGTKVCVTTAGRRDDPRSVTMACKKGR